MPVKCLSRKGSSHFPLETYFQEINETPLLTRKEEQELGCRIQKGDPAARDHMVRANLRLVVNIARQFRVRGMEFQDLIMEGNLGLFRAVECFDPSKGTRFSTYASYWITHAIRRGTMNSATTVRIPSYMVQLVQKWRRTSTQMEERLGRPPSEEEVARRLKLPPKKLKIIRAAIQIYNCEPLELHDQGGQPFDKPLPERRYEGPNHQAAEGELLDQVLGLLDQLDKREATVLRLRFGLDGEDQLTLQEIGTRLGLTRERVRQIEVGALRKLADGVAAA